MAEGGEAQEPVVSELLAYKAGERTEEELYRAILQHDTWHVAVDEQSRAMLWEIDGTQFLAAMHAELPIWGESYSYMPMGARHLLNHLPEEAGGVAFDLGLPQGLGLEHADGAGMLPALREQADAADVDALLEDRSQGDASAMLEHGWYFLARDGAPTVEYYRGLMSVFLFTAASTMRQLLLRSPELEPLDVRQAGGRDLFEHLADRDDFDAIWINAGRQPVWEPFGPAMASDLLTGIDPRPEARILPARSIAEIHCFLDQQRIAQEGRGHQLEYAGEELVARYWGSVLGDSASYRFTLVEPLADPLDFGEGPSEILCAGLLADVLRRRLASLPETLAWPPDERREYLLGATRWAAELEKLVEPATGLLPWSVLRSPDGARFVREFPFIRTREWISRSRRTAEVLAG